MRSLYCFGSNTTVPLLLLSPVPGYVASYFNGPAELFRAGRDIERVKPVMVSAARILSHSDYINRAMRAGQQIDHRRRSNSDCRRGLGRIRDCRRGFPPFARTETFQ